MEDKKATRRLASGGVPEASFHSPAEKELLMTDLSCDAVGEPTSGLEEKSRY